MKLWIETERFDSGYVILHWTEPTWQVTPKGWTSKPCYNEMYDYDARRLFRLKRLPDPEKDELFEIDLSGKPKVVCVWVPA